MMGLYRFKLIGKNKCSVFECMDKDDKRIATVRLGKRPIVPARGHRLSSNEYSLLRGFLVGQIYESLADRPHLQAGFREAGYSPAA